MRSASSAMGAALLGAARDFFRDENGTATVDFVISLPILLGILATASELGRALQYKTTLDVAVRDATRYLSRSPLDVGGAGGVSLNAQAVATAEGLIEGRFAGVEPGFLTVSVDPPIFTKVPDDSGVFEEDHYTIKIDTRVSVKMPILALLQLGGRDNDFTNISIYAEDSAMHSD